MDPIADMMIRIKNAGISKKESVVFPYSKLKLAILETLMKEGYIKSFGKKGKKISGAMHPCLSRTRSFTTNSLPVPRSPILLLLPFCMSLAKGIL